MNGKEAELIGLNEASVDGMRKEGEHGVEEAGAVEKEDRLGVVVQLAQRDRFDYLLECAEATGQGNKRIATLEHERLPLAKRLGDNQFRDGVKALFAFEQGTGDDADHVATRSEGCAGGDPHQTNPTTTIDETPATLGNRSTEIVGVHCETWVNAVA